MLKSLIKIIISIILPIVLSIILMLFGAIIINKTDVGEGIVPLFSVISGAFSSITMSYLLSKLYNIKNIYCVGIAAAIITSIKLLLTLITGNSIVININNLIDIAFIVIFSFIGALLCSNSKK